MDINVYEKGVAVTVLLILTQSSVILLVRMIQNIAIPALYQ